MCEPRSCCVIGGGSPAPGWQMRTRPSPVLLLPRLRSPAVILAQLTFSFKLRDPQDATLLLLTLPLCYC
jgi:hypothetical protein